jgi:tagatose 1,6-diphosphate aldolase
MYQTHDELQAVSLRTVEPLIDGDLQLVLVEREPYNPVTGWVPTYRFEMRSARKLAGGISLRIANTPRIVFYLGHIGYGVEPDFRGRHFAARGCRLLLPLAHAHGLSPLWITCNPDNLASRRTCELAGAALIDVVDVPRDDPLYLRGETQKCRYRLVVGARVDTR